MKRRSFLRVTGGAIAALAVVPAAGLSLTPAASPTMMGPYSLVTEVQANEMIALLRTASIYREASARFVCSPRMLDHIKALTDAQDEPIYELRPLSGPKPVDLGEPDELLFCIPADRVAVAPELALAAR